MKRSYLLLLAVLVTLVPSGARADLASDFLGSFPGPRVLYEPLASAPQLQNSNGWHARPLMVSGADAYDDGEYLYQDYIYDDHGANTSNVPADQPDTTPASTDTLFGGATGDVVYPTDTTKYAYNAADLLEFRAREALDGVHMRFTLNTMLTSDAAAIAVGIDSDHSASTGSNDWGYGIGSLGTLGLDHVLVANGNIALLDGKDVTVTSDLATNQIDVTLPLHPAGETWRTYVAVGLWDSTASNFKQILSDPTADQPGGAHMTNPPPIFNVGFRPNEPMNSQYLSDPAASVTNTTDLGARTSGNGHWREHGQAKALAARDISGYHADIDFAKLAADVDESHVAAHGYLNRLYVSHQDLGEGVKDSRPWLLGKIQPYSVYIPNTYQGQASPLHLLLHSLSCSYNQYGVFTPNQLKQIGDNRGSFLLMPEGRGPDGWWHDEAELDIFEAWADLIHHYSVDTRRVTVGGYSMGGYGTFKMGSQYPDLFARGFAVVGPADEAIQGGPTGGLSEDTQNTLHIADNLRNVPLLMWEGTNDELVPLAGTLQYEKHLSDLGYRHEQDFFAGEDHFLESIVDEWNRPSEFLGQARVNRDPEEVVYRAMPEMDNTAYGLVHDHAYWVSQVRVAEGARSALVDARSEATNVGKPVAVPTAGVGVAAQPFGGVYVSKGIQWTPTTQASSNTLDVALTDVASATLWIQRANIDTHDPITLTTDSNVASTLVFAGSFGEVSVAVPAGHNTQTINI
jgi:pimeloyl-ACP methyl ester carboxylesterase